MQHRLVQLVLQGMTGVYLVTYTFGYEMWKFTVPYMNLTAAEAFEILVYGMLHSGFVYSRCTWHHETFLVQITLTLNINNHIRGFRSRKVFGKQRLSLNLEYVLFMRQELYNFNIAFFGFSDVGIIGRNDKLIFTQQYYSGIGLGIRLHNENLVFKTFQLRLAFYPFHPSDVSFVGFILDEQSKRRFYNFEPVAPLPIRFE